MADDVNDLATFMAAIRFRESSGDYNAVSSLDNGRWGHATGAYQFLDSTWDGFGGFERAMDAPPEVQDARAAELMTSYFEQFGRWDAVAVAWHAGPGKARQFVDGGLNISSLSDGLTDTGTYVERVLTTMETEGVTASQADQWQPPDDGAGRENFDPFGTSTDERVGSISDMSDAARDFVARRDNGVPVGEFLRNALGQEGDDYVWGADPNPDDPDPDGFDCAELVQWSLERLGAPNPGGSTNAQQHWLRDPANGAIEIPIELAREIPGAVIYSVSPGRAADGQFAGHVAISLGTGQTIEAKGRDDGVGVFDMNNRFQTAFLLPGVDYTDLSGVSQSDFDNSGRTLGEDRSQFASLDLNRDGVFDRVTTFINGESGTGEAGADSTTAGAPSEPEPSGQPAAPEQGDSGGSDAPDWALDAVSGTSDPIDDHAGLDVSIGDGLAPPNPITASASLTEILGRHGVPVEGDAAGSFDAVADPASLRRDLTTYLENTRGDVDLDLGADLIDDTFDSGSTLDIDGFMGLFD